MKRAVKVLVSFLVIIISINSFSYGQESNKVTKTKKLIFKGESEKAELKIEIDSKTTFLKIEISCNLGAGDTKISIIDPDGKKRGEFTVKTGSDLTSGSKTIISENVNGSLSKWFRAPKKGKWILKFEPNKASGGASIKIEQSLSVNDEAINGVEIDPVEIEK